MNSVLHFNILIYYCNYDNILFRTVNTEIDKSSEKSLVNYLTFVEIAYSLKKQTGTSLDVPVCFIYVSVLKYSGCFARIRPSFLIPRSRCSRMISAALSPSFCRMARTIWS